MEDTRDGSHRIHEREAGNKMTIRNVTNVCYATVFGLFLLFLLCAGILSIGTAFNARQYKPQIKQEEKMGTYFLSKSFKFDAAHRFVRHDGKYARIHCHVWKGWIKVRSEKLVNDTLIDFSDLESILGDVISPLDHQNLNDVLNIERPTAENLCKIIYDEMREGLKMAGAVHIRLHSVCVIESDGSEAIYHE